MFWVQLMRLLLLAACSGLLLAPMAAAQSTDVETLAQSDAVSDAPQAVRPNGGVVDRFIASIYGLEPSGDPEVMANAGRNEVILRAPMRLLREGVLGGDIAMGQVRMKQGSRVAFLRFTSRSPLDRQSIEAWCGQGEINQFGWRPTVVCMILTPDGRATLATPPIQMGSWWAVSAMSPTAASERRDRVEILPVDEPTLIDFELVLDRVNAEQVKLRRRFAGPSVNGACRELVRGGEVELALQPGNTAQYVYDGLELGLSVNVQARTVTISSHRVAPSLDQRFEESGGFARTVDALIDAPTELQATPFVVGGVQFDPTVLVVDGAPKGPRGVLARGTMEHARTGRVVQDVELGTMLKARIPAGSLAHKVEIFRSLALGGRTSRFWCASVSALTVFGREDQLTCFHPSEDGYEGVWPDQGRGWLATTERSATIATRRASALNIEESETDLIGPMDVRIEVQRITPDQITLRVFARRNDQDALMLTVTRPIENGQAVVPMWSHRLVLDIADNKAQARLLADGDGEGLPSVGYYP